MAQDGWKPYVEVRVWERTGEGVAYYRLRGRLNDMHLKSVLPPYEDGPPRRGVASTFHIEGAMEAWKMHRGKPVMDPDD